MEVFAAVGLPKGSSLRLPPQIFSILDFLSNQLHHFGIMTFSKSNKNQNMVPQRKEKCPREGEKALSRRKVYITGKLQNYMQLAFFVFILSLFWIFCLFFASFFFFWGAMYCPPPPQSPVSFNHLSCICCAWWLVLNLKGDGFLKLEGPIHAEVRNLFPASPFFFSRGRVVQWRRDGQQASFSRWLLLQGWERSRGGGLILLWVVS